MLTILPDLLYFLPDSLAVQEHVVQFPHICEFSHFSTATDFIPMWLEETFDVFSVFPNLSRPVPHDLS